MEPTVHQCSLETLQQIYLKVVEASPDAMIVVNSRGYIEVFNVQAELMFGYDRSEILGKPLEILLPDTVRHKHARHRIHYFEEPKTREMGLGQNLQGLHRDGKVFRVQIKLSPIVVPGAGVHTLAVVRRVSIPDTDAINADAEMEAISNMPPIIQRTSSVETPN